MTALSNPSSSNRRRLLVINPNTSTHITAMLQRVVEQVAGDSLDVQAVTARFGASYIASQAAYAVAAHATLDAWAHAWAQDSTSHRPMHDAIMIGCFGDPGLLALRELAPVPVTGLAEAAMLEASQRGTFGIVTGGSRWQPMLWQLAKATDMRQLQAVETVDLTGGQMAAEPEKARSILRQACEQLLQRHPVQSIILGGAGLAGQAAHLQQHVPVPLIDCVEAATRHLLTLPRQAKSDPLGNLPTTAWQGLAPDLETALNSIQAADRPN